MIVNAVKLKSYEKNFISYLRKIYCIFGETSLEISNYVNKFDVSNLLTFNETCCLHNSNMNC